MNGTTSIHRGGGGGGDSSHPTTTAPVSTSSSSSSSVPSSNYHWRNHHHHRGSTHIATTNSTILTDATWTVTVLSVYDLPYREPPSYIHLSIRLPSSSSSSNSHLDPNNIINVRTGPPTQRHRDRNSFKFGNTTTHPMTPTMTGTSTAAAATTTATPSPSTALSQNTTASSSSSPSLSRTLTITHSNLSELYHAVATLQVVYVTTTTSADASNSRSSSSSSSNDTTVPYNTTTTTTSFVSQYPLSKCNINETTWNILVCQTVPQSTSYTTHGPTGISSTIHHPPPPPPPSSYTPKVPRSTTNPGVRRDDDDDEDEDDTDNNNNTQEDMMMMHLTVPPPTIRIQMTLNGPYRSEIRTILYYGKLYLQGLDDIEQSITTLPISQWFYQQCLRPMGNVLFSPDHPPHPTHHHTTNRSPVTTILYWTMVFWILPLLVLIGLVLIPIVTGIFMVTLPLMFPIVFLTIGLLCATSCTLFLYYCSSSNPICGGRTYIYQTILHPIIQTILSSQIGQHMVYDIGPRYQPIILLLHQYHIVPMGEDHNAVLQKLLYAIVLDAVGSSSYLLPGLGECMDVVWAPIQTIFIMALFTRNDNEDQDANPNNNNIDNPNTPSYTTTTRNDNASDIYQDKVNAVLPYLSFLEEILPFTDFVPTATIGWFCIYGIIPLVLLWTPHSKSKND